MNSPLNLKRDIRRGLGLVKTCEMIKEQGGFIIVPHAFDRLRRGVGNSINKIVKYVDAIEGLNARSLFGEFNNKNVSIFEAELFRRGRVNLPTIFNVKDVDATWEFDVYYPDVSGVSHCIRFPVPRHSNLTINVTMLREIANFTFGRPEFIEKNYTSGNSVIARLMPYPCCDITNVPLQTAEVCSSNL